MSAISIQQMADRVSALIEDKLRARGTGLAAKLHARGGALPRKVYVAAAELAKTAEMAQQPKLLLQIDHESLARNYDLCVHHLSGLKPRSGLMENTLAVAASIAVSMLLIAFLLIALLRWRGLI